MDYKPIYQNCSVFCEEVTNPHEAKRIVMSACQAALSENGVAVVILPSDISGAEVEDLPIMQQYQPKAPLVRPVDAEIRAIAEILNSGKKVGIFAGAGCEGAHAELMQLCETLKSPIAHTSRAKDFVEGNNPYNVGMTGMLGVKSGILIDRRAHV